MHYQHALLNRFTLTFSKDSIIFWKSNDIVRFFFSILKRCFAFFKCLFMTLMSSFALDECCWILWHVLQAIIDISSNILAIWANSCQHEAALSFLFDQCELLYFVWVLFKILSSRLICLHHSKKAFELFFS